MIKVEYSSNNSGGSWWLEDKDWVALYDAGWQLRRNYGDCKYTNGGKATPDDDLYNWSLDPNKAIEDDSRWLGAICKEARKDFASMREAVEEWENLTGGNAADEGCNCCGEPHYFSGKDSETGEYVNGPEIRRESYLEW